MMRKERRISIGDVVTMILVALIIVFIIAMVSGYNRHSGFGFFRAIQLAWCDVCDWIGEKILGIEIGYKADVEIPMVNTHISIVSYTR